MVICSATPSDIDLVVSSRLDFLDEVRAPNVRDGAVLEVETRSFVIAESTAGRLHTWIAEDGGEFAGIVSVLLWPRPPRPDDFRVMDGYIINMFVPPHRQRRGVGRRLLEHCLHSSRELGIGRFVLDSTDQGRRLYESVGFTPTANWMDLPVAP